MSAAIIKFDSVTKTYPIGFGRRTDPVFSDVSWHVDVGEKVGIFGPSGCGKSTLLRMFFSLIDWDTGTIRFRGRSINSMTLDERRAMHTDVQVVFQDPSNAFNPRWRLRESLREPIRLLGIDADDDKLLEHVRRLSLESGMLDRYPHQLSGGQLQRLTLLRCLLASPDCLFLDEASSMLDVSVQAHMMHVINDLHTSTRMSVVFISHDWDLVHAMCDRVYCFSDNTMHEVNSDTNH